MPVDYLPCIFFVIFGVTLVVTIIAFVKKVSRKSRFVSLFFLLIVPIAYAWTYHSKQLFLLSAAEHGDAQAALRLGRSYMNYRDGSPYDPPKGRELLTRAAEAGLVEAQMVLGCYYLTGVATPQNDAEAIHWFNMAAQEGEPDAIALIEDITANGFDGWGGKSGWIVSQWMHRE